MKRIRKSTLKNGPRLPVGRNTCLAVAAALAVVVAGGQGFSAAPGQPSQCVECHTQLDDNLAKPVKGMQTDVHFRIGLSCESCHGGDPSQSDPEAAMNPARGFVGKPAAAALPAFCGKCHSNAAVMKRYNPGLRVDQEMEYWTSVHGQRVKQGDTRVATCISCHGVHGIRSPSDPLSPVYPINVSATCGKCHANAEYMKAYSIPTDQLKQYRSSVHAKALFEGNDLSAPTCNDCHGNHGATPPGVSSVVNVCGACHTRQNELFQKSPHQAAFQAADLAGCLACHGNHGIQAPTDALLGTADGSTCVNCHSEGDAGYRTAARMRSGIDSMIKDLGTAQHLVDRARTAGMEVSRADFQLKEAHDSLINARVVAHSFNVAAIDKEIGTGRQIAQKAAGEGRHALAELQFRRKGLATSLLLIGFAVVALYMKIRKIERRDE